MKRELLKFLSLVLVLCLLFTAFPVAAAQGDNGDGEGVSFGSGINISSADELGEEYGTDNGVKVFSVEVEGKIASAEFETARDAVLVVAVYTEDGGTMLGSGSKAVTIDDKTAEITLEIETMPQYFYLRAFMIDVRTLKPLCRSYECPNYTREMQEFFGKSTADFVPDRVLSFDESSDNNFAVYKDSVILFEKSDSVNIVASVDEQNKIYIFQNADETLLGLKEGDIFACENSGHGLVIVKVSAVTVDGTTVTVTGGDISLEEVFDYVKIEGRSDLSTAEFKSSRMDSDVHPVGGEEPETTPTEESTAASEETTTTEESTENPEETEPTEEGTINPEETEPTEEGTVNPEETDPTEESTGNPEETNPKNEAEIQTATKAFTFERSDGESGAYASGAVTLSAEATVKVFLTRTQKYVELSVNYCAETDLTLDFNGREEFSLGEFCFRPIKNRAVGVEISFAPALALESNGSVNTSGALTGLFGLRASKQGIENISRRPEFTSELHEGIKLFVGSKYSSSASVCFLPEAPEPGKAVSAQMSGEYGIEYDAVMRHPGTADSAVSHSMSTEDSAVSHSMSTEDSAESIHDCSACVAGKQYFRRQNSVGVCFMNDASDFTDELPENKTELRDFYYSKTHGSFGWTTCPHIQYRVDVTVKDENNSPVSGAEVSGEGVTDDRGNITFYLPNGSCIISAVKDGRSVEKTVEIKGRAIGVTLTLPDDGGSSGGGETPVGSDVIAVEAGSSHSSALTKDGTLYMWGLNDHGQLGDGSDTDHSSARKVNSVAGWLPEHSVRQVSLGGAHSAAVTFDGSLYVWGSNEYGQIGKGKAGGNVYLPKKIMDNVKSVALGENHSAALTTDGSLYMWGRNDCGQIGNGATEDECSPVKVMDDVKYIALGENHSAAVTTDGSLYMWGGNDCGQIGNGEDTNSASPEKIMINIASVSLGNKYSAAVTTDGTLYAWGHNDHGQLGDGSEKTRIVPVRIATDIHSVACGGAHTAAVSRSSALYAWGSGSDGALGTENTDASSLPVRIAENIAQASAGSGFTIALTNDGSALACGCNGFGQVGDGSTENRFALAEIEIWDHTPALNGLAGVKVGGDEDKTVTFNGYKPNVIYNFYAMKVREDGLGSDNLLYLRQVTADSNGSVIVVYTGTEDFEAPTEFLTALEDVDVADITVEAVDHIYNGNRQYYQPVLKSGGYELCEGVDYIVKGVYCASDAGEYTVIIRGRGVFAGKRSESFVIASRNVSGANVENEDEFLYCGAEIKPAVTVSDEYRTLVEETDYEITYQNNKNPGIAAAEIKGKGNYTGRKVITFDILYCDISKNSVVELGTVPQYTGEPITPDLTLTVNGNALEKDTDYSLTYYNNINKGIGIIEIKGLGGYMGRIIYWFDIVECDLGRFGDCSAVKYLLYNGEERSPEPVVTVNDKQLVKGVDYTVAYSDNTSAGTATITVTGIGNYAGTLTYTFEIIDKQIGDANFDDTINVKDVTAIQRSLAEYEPLNEVQNLVADVNDDGRISIEDASGLKRILCEFSDIELYTMEEPEDFNWKDSPVHGKIKTDYRSTYDIDFDVSAYKNNSASALYVSPDGSDDNSGTIGEPLFSMKKAYENGADTIYLLPGIYTSAQTLCGTAVTRNINIIGLSEGEVILSTDVHSDMTRLNEESPVWSAEREGLSNVIDLNNRTADGYYTKYIQLNTLDDVAANEGSWAFVSGVAYVHTIGGIEPTEENGILLLNGNKKTPLIKITAGNLYLENLICLEGSSPLLAETNNSNYREINVYGKNCRFFYSMTINNDVCMMKGVSLAIFQNCEASFGLKDGFNYHTRSGIIPKAVEINCRGIGNGNIEDGNDQGSTIHDGGSIIRVGDICARNYGSNYAEQGTGTESWNIDCIGYESYCAVTTIQNANFFAYGNTKIFCDGCAGFGCYYNVNNSADETKEETPGEIYLRNDRFSGVLTDNKVEIKYY